MLFQKAVFWVCVGRIADKLDDTISSFTPRLGASVESAVLAHFCGAPSSADKGKRERHATPHTQSNNYYYLLAAPIG